MYKRLDAETHRKRYSIFVLIPLALLLIAAGKSPAGFEKYRGHYVFGHEVRTFQPCNSDRIYWVRAGKDIAKRLRTAHQKMTTNPYEAIYIEVQGRLMGKTADGFAADYDGQLEIEDIDEVRARQKDDCNR